MSSQVSTTGISTTGISVVGISVVGIGADGWAGLGEAARSALDTAEVIFGSRRQLDLLPPGVDAEQVAWPSPLVPALAGLLAVHQGRRRAVLASGDPTFHGIATTIGRVCPELPLIILPQPSCLSLACARLGWAQQDVELVSLVGRPVEVLHPAVQPGRRVLVLAAGAHSAAEVAGLLTGRGFGPSRLVLLGELGGKGEQRRDGVAESWVVAGDDPALAVIAIECLAGPAALRLSRSAGLPDDAYENDGQLTKRQVRAITLAALAPSPGELLWDVGGGAGSIGIEWLRQHPSCRAISVERDAERAARIRRNAAALGVPALEVVLGSAPAALAGLATPDAIFIGGGASLPGLIHTCWQALPAGGRMVVNVTTLESEQAVVTARSRYGGDLIRIEISTASPIGRYTGWRPAMPVTQWTVARRSSEEDGLP